MTALTDWLEDLRTFFVPISRKRLRELPMRFVVIFALDAPLLVFECRDLGRVQQLQEWIKRDFQLRRRAYDVERKKYFARKIRDNWLCLVALAIGYTWPGNPPGWIEFAADDFVPAPDLADRCRSIEFAEPTPESPA